MKYKKNNNELTISLEGRIDTSNSKEIENELLKAVSDNSGCTLVLDAGRLEYISSAGLRVLMLLSKRQRSNITVINASPAVYEVFEMTGFTELLDVRRRLKEVSVDGLPLIGAGANGSVYRLDEERIIKVYNPLTNPPEKIFREKEAAKQAFIHDIPSAISFDIVRVGDGYGIIYEMLDAKTLGAVCSADPDSVEIYGRRMARLLRQLHSTAFEEGVLPDARKGLCVWADVAETSGYYEQETISKLRRFIDDIPQRNTFIHGDFHPANIMVKGDEWLLIDMGDASVGHPVIDLLGSYQIMKLVAERANGAQRYTGISADDLKRLWNVFVREYFGTNDDGEITEIEKILKYYAIIRSMGGVTFSELIPEAVKRNVTREVESAFLEKYDKYGSTLLPRLGL